MKFEQNVKDILLQESTPSFKRKTFEPVIKWSGSKRSQSEMIISKIPKKEYNTYYEPFCGGCSILYQLLHSDIKINEYICSDINKDLIDLWNLIKENPNLISKTYNKMWNELNIDNDLERKKKYFNMVRDRFNKYKNSCDFMFIMRTTTNGMPRYNKNGNFNNSFHITRNGINPKRLDKIIHEWSDLINKHNVLFIHRSYSEIYVESNDLLYLDPPYSHTKGMYFGGINNDNLWTWLREQHCDYLLSFDGKVTNLPSHSPDINEKTTSIDNTYEVPKNLYDTHEYISSGNSSFRRVIGNSTKEYVEESLYIKQNY